MRPLTPAERCFFIYFECLIPEAFLYSQEIDALWGTPISGIRKRDQAAMTAERDMSICLADMAEYHARSAPVRLRNPYDAWKMYTHVKDLLVSWQVAVQNDINRNDIPVEELSKLDSLANMLYNMAVRYGGVPEKQIETRSMFNGLTAGRLKRAPVAVEPVVAPEYKSVVDEITLTAIERSRSWG